MPLLALDGIPLDAYLSPSGTQRLEPELVGEQRRAFAGGMRDDVLAVKEKWKLITTPLQQSDAQAIRALVEGLGDVCRCEDEWTTSGRRASATGVPVFGAGKYGNCAQLDGATLAFDFSDLLGKSGPWTLSYWWSDDNGATWYHRLHSSAGLKWQNGLPSLDDFGDAAMSLGVLTLSDVVNSPSWFDDVAVFAAALPVSMWPDIYAEHSARPWTAFPELRATGELVPAEPRLVRGHDRGGSVVAVSLAGLWGVNREELEFELEET